ncbi:hypothetical protein [Neptuniibacter sp. QD37_11]|uniref:hypothetical protein n=1 Tax=Neptuniibacter sp. QD37_11 TaxID=3398209 RepID=UPI0039F4A5C9
MAYLHSQMGDAIHLGFWISNGLLYGVLLILIMVAIRFMGKMRASVFLLIYQAPLWAIIYLGFGYVLMTNQWVEINTYRLLAEIGLIESEVKLLTSHPGKWLMVQKGHWMQI